MTAGRHVTSKDGLVFAKERSAHVEANRKASAKLFDSDRKSVLPERRGVQHLK
jgi:predicted regulator of Ras-like GTPase activity (Roadblock/LC7/MglB family)